MTDAFAFTETDRTKSKWVAAVYRDFLKEIGRPQITLRGLFYFALKRAASDYPICGGFVGEIRITRPYHENDGEKLAKWAGRAIELGYIPPDFILPNAAAEKIFLPESRSMVPGNNESGRTKSCKTESSDEKCQNIEVWVSNPSLHPLLAPVCQKHNAALVSVPGRASAGAIEGLLQRSEYRSATVLCLSDFSRKDAFFSRILSQDIGKLCGAREAAKVRVKRIGLLPQQMAELNIPLIRETDGSREHRKEFDSLLRSFSFPAGRKGELDALEVFYPGGIASFLDDILSQPDPGAEVL